MVSAPHGRGELLLDRDVDGPTVAEDRDPTDGGVYVLRRRRTAK